MRQRQLGWEHLRCWELQLHDYGLAPYAWALQAVEQGGAQLGWRCCCGAAAGDALWLQASHA